MTLQNKVSISFLFLATLSSNSLSGEIFVSDIYMNIANFLDQQKVDWFNPSISASEKIDVSSEICPMVDIDKLEQLLAARPEFIQSNPVDKAMGLPEGTTVWTVRRPIRAIFYQVLSIYVGKDGYCEARYRHIH